MRERQAIVAVTLLQAVTGARRMLAGVVALAFAVIGVALILFPLASNVILAAGALATSFSLAGYAIARRRRRRESDAG